MKLSAAVPEFFLALRADGYSKDTIRLHGYALRVLVSFLDDKEVDEIEPIDLTKYFLFLREEYKPIRWNGKTERLGGSSLQNHWKAVRCFFNWASDALPLKERPDKKLKMPPNNPKAIVPFSEEDVQALLAASPEYKMITCPGCDNGLEVRRPTYYRDKSIILCLLDTGLRISELTRLDIQDVDIETGEVFIKPFGDSGRKTKSRLVYLGETARNALKRYLATRKNANLDEPLFLSFRGDRVRPNTIRQTLKKLGSKTGIRNVHPHRFRHTFAIQYLRNEGDIFTLQRQLGHSTLDMVQHYLRLADEDSREAHRRASPADRWTL